jgi:hypothetical protein
MSCVPQCIADPHPQDVAACVADMRRGSVAPPFLPYDRELILLPRSSLAGTWRLANLAPDVKTPMSYLHTSQA